MARSRVIKPEFWSDEKLARLSLPARLLYIGLWNTCDDVGRSRGHPLWLKSQIFPYDDLSAGQIEEWLSDLVNLRRIFPYTVNSELYYFIPGFLKHQKIQHPSPAKNPPPPQDSALPGQAQPPPPPDESPENVPLFMSASGAAHEQTETERETERETETEGHGGASFNDPLFEQFWKAYPRKKSKGHAEKAWSLIKPDRPFLARMLEAIERDRASPDWRREGGKYIPYPARWLYGKSWEDEAGKGREGKPGGGHSAEGAVDGPLPSSIAEKRKPARTFTGPEPLRLILERHGLDPASGQFPDG